MSSSPVYIFAKWQINAGEKENVLKLLSDVAAKSVEEAGNIFYKVFQSSTEPDTLLLYEAYKNEEALAEHRNAEYFKQIVIGQIVPKLQHRDVTVASEISFLLWNGD